MNEPAVGTPDIGTAPTLADTALAELHGGIVGTAAVELLRRLGRQCTRSSRTNFPPPDGYDQWTDDAVDDLLADMFDRPDANNPGECHKFVLNCYARATDGPSLERLLLTTIENFLKDQAKGTERGKLRRRITGLLQKDGRFSQCADDRWGLVGGCEQPWQGDLATLEQAAFAVRGVQITSWNHSGTTPKATVSALILVIETVLVKADGSVRTEDLARVLQARFELLRVPRFVSIDDIDTELPRISDGKNGDIALRAQQLFESLTDPERQLLPFLDEPQRWKTILGVGKAVAKATGEALIEKVRLATADDDDRDEVIIQLAQLCRQTGTG